MRVLVVAPVVPWPLHSGGALRTFHVARETARHAEVHLWAVRQPECVASAAERALTPHVSAVRLFERSSLPPWTRLARTKREAWFHSRALATALAEDELARSVDLVHLDEPCVVRLLPRDFDVPVLVQHHKLDLEFARSTAGGRNTWLGRREIARTASMEDAAARRTRHHLFCSSEDSARWSARHPDHAPFVVENGFDPAVFPADALDPLRDPTRLLFVGALDYAPNLEGLEFFVQDVLPRVRRLRPEAELEIVGSRPGDRARALVGPSVRLSGQVESTKPSLERVAVVVVPLLTGGGTRLKIVEALAAGTAVVSTRVGAEGLALEDREHLWLADDADAFASAVAFLLEHPEKARELGKRGRARVHELYRWDRLAARMLEAWRIAAAGSGAA